MGKVIPTLTNTTYITKNFASKLPQNYLKAASKLLDFLWPPPFGGFEAKKKCLETFGLVKTRVYQPRGDCFKNAGSPCRMIFWVILILILAGFCFLRLGTDRPKCLKINFLCGFSCDFAKYTFWTTCHTLCNVSNCLISKCLCSQCLQMLLLEAKASLWFTPVRQLVSQSVS